MEIIHSKSTQANQCIDTFYVDSVYTHIQPSKDGSHIPQISVTLEEKVPPKNPVVTSDTLTSKWVLYTGPEDKCDPLAHTFQQWQILMVDRKLAEPFT